MKIGIVGSGISGLMAASELHKNGHQVTVFEAGDSIGGHVKTISYTFEEGEPPLILEAGTTVFDPVLMHRNIGAKAKELAIPHRRLDMAFTFINRENDIAWTMYPPIENSLIKDLKSLAKFELSALKNESFVKQNLLLRELRRFFRDMRRVSVDTNYGQVGLEQFVGEQGYSKLLQDAFIQPNLLFWWGVTSDQASNCSIQVIADSFNIAPRKEQYIFTRGWMDFMKAIAAPFKEDIRINSKVDSVVRNKGQIDLTANNTTETYDHVIFSTPPNVVDELLKDKTSEEIRNLRSFSTTTTEVILHTDSSWMPKNDKWALGNLVQDERGTFITHWVGGYDPRKPKVFVSWGEDFTSAISPKYVILRREFVRTLPTVGYYQACHQINNLQGDKGIWYCGAHVDALDPEGKGIAPSLWHENAFLSGIAVANRIINI
ncbi:hypothetical protein SCG7086_AQ_00090 [Chlamydiales bacterium SCGC AG-110-P3]|nr:hypothetical protein SCG7086_AQ_00090 [Chlamydiales bacterium SCGC AG-110-P3]